MVEQCLEHQFYSTIPSSTFAELPSPRYFAHLQTNAAVYKDLFAAGYSLTEGLDEDIYNFPGMLFLKTGPDENDLTLPIMSFKTERWGVPPIQWNL